MTIKVGDKVPDVTVSQATAEGPKPVKTGEFFAGKTVALFALPGAFTPTCSAKHLPGCKQLDTADSWNDAKFKINAKVGDRLDNADGGVVEGRISPHQKTDRAAIGGLGGNDFGIPLSSGIMPGRYAGLILRSVTLPIGSSLLISYLHEPIMIMGDQRPAELLA